MPSLQLTNEFFPFEQIGFQANPFRALTDEEWAELAVLPSEILLALEEPEQHLQILGNMGRGKSTILRGLKAYLKYHGERTTYEYLPLGTRHFTTTIKGLDTFLLDEAQRLWIWERRRLLSAARRFRIRLIVSCHRDLTVLFDRYHMMTNTIVLDRVGFDHVATLLSRRLNYFAIDDVAPSHFTPEAIQYLLDQFGSDLRSMEYFLYEVFQRLEQTGPISASLLKATETVLQVTE